MMSEEQIDTDGRSIKPQDQDEHIPVAQAGMATGTVSQVQDSKQIEHASSAGGSLSATVGLGIVQGLGRLWRLHKIVNHITARAIVFCADAVSGVATSLGNQLNIRFGQRCLLLLI